MSKFIHSALTCIFVLFIGIAAAFEANKIFMSFRPPVQYEQHTAEAGTVKAGQKLVILTRINRDRHCRASLDIFITNTESRDVVRRESVAAGATDLGTANLRRSYDIPQTTPPGDYQFISRGYYDCAEGTHVLIFPTINFRVVD